MQVNAPTVSQIMDYITGRWKFMRLQICILESVVSDTQAPQGTILSPFLFTLHTMDFKCSTSACLLQELLWRLLQCGQHRQWRWVRVQEAAGGVCLVVWGEPPAAGHQQDKGAGGWFPAFQGTSIQQENVVSCKPTAWTAQLHCRRKATAGFIDIHIYTSTLCILINIMVIFFHFLWCQLLSQKN